MYGTISLCYCDIFKSPQSGVTLYFQFVSASAAAATAAVAAAAAMTFAFYPRPVLAFGYCRCLRVCVCVCLSVNHQLVRAVTHQPFKLESPNLDQRCKKPWLRSLLFFGMIDRELQGEIELKSQNLPHFELVRAISHHQLKSVFPNFGQKCILALLRSLLILG